MLLLRFVRKFCTTLLRILDSVLVLLERQKADHTFVAAILGLQRVDQRTLARELHEEVETGGLVLNRVSELFEPPLLHIHELTAVLGDDTLEFVSHLLNLSLGENRRDNENGFVIVHNAKN